MFYQIQKTLGFNLHLYDMVSAIVDIPQIGVKMIFSNKMVNFYNILGEIMQKILGL